MFCFGQRTRAEHERLASEMFALFVRMAVRLVFVGAGKASAGRSQALNRDIHSILCM